MRKDEMNSNAQNEWVAEWVDELRDEAASAVMDALAKEPWCNCLTEDQKTGLAEVHHRMTGTCVWKATAIWRESGYILGETVLLDPEDECLYLANIECLGSEWGVTGCPENIGTLLFSHFLSMWNRPEVMAIYSKTYLCGGDFDDVVGELKRRAGQRATMSGEVTP